MVDLLGGRKCRGLGRLGVQWKWGGEGGGSRRGSGEKGYEYPVNYGGSGKEKIRDLRSKGALVHALGKRGEGKESLRKGKYLGGELCYQGKNPKGSG